MSVKIRLIGISLHVVKSERCEKSLEILKYSHKSCFALVQAYHLARAMRMFVKNGKQKDKSELKKIKLLGGFVMLQSELEFSSQFVSL